MAVVPSNTNTSVAVAKAPKSPMAEFNTWADKTREIAEKEKSIRIKGTSFPFTVNDIRKLPESGYEPSTMIIGTIGSLQNCRGDGITRLGPEMILLNMIKGQNDTMKNLRLPFPTSHVTDKEIDRLLLYKGRNITLFCPTDRVGSVFCGGLYDAVSASVTYTVKPPKAADPAATPGAAAKPARPKLFVPVRKQLASLPITPRGTPAWPAGCGAAIADAAAPAAAATPTQLPPEVIEALSQPLPWTTRDEILKAFGDPATTPAQLLRIEYEYPELAGTVGLPADLQEKGYEASVNVGCEDFWPLQKEEYPGQGRADMISMYKRCPEIETVIDVKTLKESALKGTTFTLVARPLDMMEKECEARFNDLQCRVSIADKFVYKTTPVVKDGKTFSALTFNTKALYPGTKNPVPGIQLGFAAMALTWPPGTSRAAPANEKIVFRGTVLGTEYINVIAPAFGVTNSDAWDRLGKLIVDNTVAWHCVRVNKVKTADRPFNRHNRGTPVSAEVVVNPVYMIPDFATSLRERIGIPITAERADELVRRVNPRSPQVPLGFTPAEAARYARAKCIQEVTCLTENPHLLTEAIAAGCEFYAITTSQVQKPDSGVKFSRLGPEVGAALFDVAWYDKKPYEIQDASKVIVDDPPRPLGKGKMMLEISHSVRWDTVQISRDLLSADTTIYVYAVRPPSATGAERYEAALKIYQNGGSYNEKGTPLVENSATAVAIDEMMGEEGAAGEEDSIIIGGGDEFDGEPAGDDFGGEDAAPRKRPASPPASPPRKKRSKKDE